MGEYARGSADGPLKIFGRLNINKLLKNSKANDKPIESDSSSVLKDFVTSENPPHHGGGYGTPLDYNYQGAGHAYSQNFMTDINSQSFSGSENTPIQGGFGNIDNMEPRTVKGYDYSSRVSVYKNSFGSPRVKTSINEDVGSNVNPSSQPTIDSSFRDFKNVGAMGETDLSEEGATLLKWKLNSHMPKGSQISRVNVKSGIKQKVGMEIDSVMPTDATPDNYAQRTSDEQWEHAHNAWNEALSSSGEDGKILTPLDRDIYAYSKGGKLPFNKAFKRYQKDIKNSIMSRVRKNKNIPLTLSGKPNTSKMLGKVGLRRSPEGIVFDNKGSIIKLEMDSRDKYNFSKVLGDDFSIDDHETVSHLAYIHANAAREFSKKLDEGYSVREAGKYQDDYLRSSCKDLYSVMNKNNNKSFADIENKADKAAEVLSRIKVLTV